MAETSTRVKIVRRSFSLQGTVLVDLPEIPGVVVQVSRVLWMVESFSAVTAVGIRLYHDIDVNKTLAFAEIPPNLWMLISQGLSGGSDSQAEVVFSPSYDLVGKQRFDFVSSAGTVVGHLTIHYTTRAERNRTVWNELRARTSFERD